MSRSRRKPSKETKFRREAKLAETLRWRRAYEKALRQDAEDCLNAEFAKANLAILQTLNVK